MHRKNDKTQEHNYFFHTLVLNVSVKLQKISISLVKLSLKINKNTKASEEIKQYLY
jgi:hypothetical protein